MGVLWALVQTSPSDIPWDSFWNHLATPDIVESSSENSVCPFILFKMGLFTTIFWEKECRKKLKESLDSDNLYIPCPLCIYGHHEVNWQLFYFPLQEDGTWWLIHKIYNAGRDSIQSLFSIGLGRQWWRYYYGLPSGCQPLYARRHAEELIIKQSFL